VSLRINDTAPNFTAETTQGTINFHEWIGDGWAILFSHPKDFTPVCTTELGYMAGLQPEFAKRNTKILGLSVDPVTNHSKWAADIEETQGHKVSFPMIGDPELKIAKLYDEVLRVLDSMQLTAKHKVATPVNWKQGEEVIILPSVSNDEAKAKYPNGWKSPKPYLRIVPQPK
jgi:alkyl hydroperoxide reductase subunit AhpC